MFDILDKTEVYIMISLSSCISVSRVKTRHVVDVRCLIASCCAETRTTTRDPQYGPLLCVEMSTMIRTCVCEPTTISHHSVFWRGEPAFPRFLSHYISTLVPSLTNYRQAHQEWQLCHLVMSPDITIEDTVKVS